MPDDCTPIAIQWLMKAATVYRKGSHVAGKQNFNFCLASCSIVLCSIHCAVYWSYVELVISLLLLHVQFIAVELITSWGT